MSQQKKGDSQNVTTIDTFNLASNLSDLMRKHGLSESELARALDIPYNTIRRITSRFTTDPRMSTLKLIANYFNIGLDALISQDLSMTANTPTRMVPPRSVPIFTWDIISQQNFLNTVELKHWEQWQPIALAPTEDLSSQAYALESKHSMQPRFSPGTIFIVDPEKNPIDEDLVLVKIKETGAVSLRSLIIDPPTWQLLPVIENSSAIEYCDKEHEIIGIVALIIARIRRKRT